MRTLPVRSESTLLKETTSRCPVCLSSIPARVIEQAGQVVMSKACPQHGRCDVVLAADRSFYHLTPGRSADGGCCAPAPLPPGRRGASGDVFETLSTCIALIEIVDTCNLSCPACYADSPRTTAHEGSSLPWEQFVERVEAVIARKGEIEILQLSGGEPTLHPEFLRLLEWTLRHERIGYVLLNTNGVRVARDAAFRERLGELRRELRGFELYLQFDGPQLAGQHALRGADLRALRRDAIDLAGESGVPTTLAMVVTPTTLPHLGDTLRFGLEREHCRGITFQPLFSSGRIPPGSGARPDRPISVGDVVRELCAQSEGVVEAADFTPLPCGDPNCHTVGYLLRSPDGVLGLSRLVDLPALQGFLGQRVNYDLEDLLRCGCETEPLGEVLRRLELGPHHPFRLFIKPFMDAWTFDQDRIDRCCTHVITPNGTLDSFCRYYLQGPAQECCPG